MGFQEAFEEFVVSPVKSLNRYVYIWDFPCISSLDTSGSTSSRLSTGNTILEESVTIVRDILKKKKNSDARCISWNTIGTNKTLNSVRSGGGTDPASMFPMLDGIKTLLVTTDGEFHAVDKVVPLVRQSSIIHVVAVYIGRRCSPPSYLNLPVFAPFMEVPGIFVLCHFDGESLKLLLTNNVEENQFPDIPLIDKNTKWSDFPTLDIKILHTLVSKKQEKLDYNPRYISINNDGTMMDFIAFTEEIRRNPDLTLTKDFEEFIMNEHLPKDFQFSSSVIEIMNIWRKRKISQVDRLVEEEFMEENPNFKELKLRAKELYDNISNNDKSCKKEFAEITEKLYEIGLNLRGKQIQGRSSTEQLYNHIIRNINTKSNSSSYTLQDLQKRVTSNRANRATIVSEEVTDLGFYDFTGAITTECDICAIDRPFALLLIQSTPEQIANNTCDGAMNDILSLGPSNKNNFPGSNLCVYCAHYLLKNGHPCPYTRQSISSILPCVKPSPVHTKLLSEEISKAFFGCRKLFLEFQLLLSCIDQVQSRFPKKIIDFWMNYILNHTNANFMGPYGTSKLCKDAILSVISFPVSENNFESWLAPLRNKTIFSITLMCRIALRYNLHPSNLFQDVVFRAFIKMLVSRMLLFVKEDPVDNLRMLQLALESDLYNTSTTGIPIRNSRKYSNLTNSNTIKLLFDKDFLKDNILEPLTTYCDAIKVKLDTFIPSEPFLFILSHAINNLQNVSIKPESFLVLLMKNMDFKNIFWRRMNLVNVQLHNDFKSFSVFTKGDPHALPVKFSPVNLSGPAITSCTSCGTPFIHQSDFDLPIEELVKIVKNNRNSHFKTVYHGEHPNDTSSHYNLHKAVAISLQSFFELNINRDMVLTVLHYIRSHCKGNIHETQVIRSVVAVIWDYIQKVNSGIEPSDVYEYIDFKSRLSEEIHYLKLEGKSQIGIDLATLDGLSKEEIKELTAPLSEEEVLDFIQLPKSRVSLPKPQKFPLEFITIINCG